MLSGRMLRILDYLNCHQTSSYKEIANDLDIKDRYIRYDLDKINDYLSLHKYPLIEKQPKGVIVFPHNIDVSLLVNDDSFIYTVKERISLIYYILLFDYRRMNIEHLSHDFQVSRTTIKNDVAYLEEFLSQYNIELFYDRYFDIKNYNRNIIDIMNNELSQYIYLFKDAHTQMNSFETYAYNMVIQSFPGISIKEIICYIDRIFEKNRFHFNDESYSWVVSNILLLIWFLTHREDLPEGIGFDAPKGLNKYYEDIKELEDMIGEPITHYYRGALIRLLDYINDNEGLYQKLDILQIQTIMTQLVEKMSKDLEIDFSKDHVLIEGLFNHIAPLMKRMSSSLYMYHHVISIIPEQDQYIYEILKKGIKEIDILNQLDNEDEIAYLAVHFIASIRRMKKVVQKRILVVCNHGYGSSTMLKELLMNEFQVKIIDMIPAYQLSTYPYLDNVDCIVSTVSLKNTYHKLNVVVSPILTEIDYKKLIEIGLQRKEVRMNYHSLSHRLNFLDDEDRHKVLEIIQSELGHSGSKITKLKYKVSDLLEENCIDMIDEEIDWQNIIMKSASLLEKNKNVVAGYGNQIVNDIMNTGFYCVTDQCFALFHGSEQEDVYRSGISLIVNKKEMCFDDKKVHIVFCLASKDKKDQIPAMILLMRMVKKTQLLQRLQQATSRDDIFNIIKECEKEVID